MLQLTFSVMLQAFIDALTAKASKETKSSFSQDDLAAMRQLFPTMVLDTPIQSREFTSDMCAKALPLAEEAQKCFFSADKGEMKLSEREILSNKGIELLNQRYL